MAEVFSNQGYNNNLADEIKLWKGPCKAPFSLLLLSVILFVPRGSWRRRGIAVPQAFGILVCAEWEIQPWMLYLRGFVPPLVSAPWAGKKRILLVKEKQSLSYSEGKNKQKMRATASLHSSGAL